MTINDRKTTILNQLDAQKDQEQKYRFLVEFGRKSPGIDEASKDDKFLIEGCMSKAWLKAQFKNGVVYFEFDSEAAIVKGIMSVLCFVYSESTPQEILSTPPDFLKTSGISDHLSMNRRSGMSSVLKQMMLYATAYKAISSLK